MSKELEIDKMLTISTAHITSETNDWLDSGWYCPVVVYEKEDYGWFIYIPDFLSELTDEYNVPPDLLECMEFAKLHGCSWLCLDRDGMEVDELDEYEW